jgi:hypothetical protein
MGADEGIFSFYQKGIADANRILFSGALLI